MRRAHAAKKSIEGQSNFLGERHSYYNSGNVVIASFCDGTAIERLGIVVVQVMIRKARNGGTKLLGCKLLSDRKADISQV